MGERLGGSSDKIYSDWRNRRYRSKSTHPDFEYKGDLSPTDSRQAFPDATIKAMPVEVNPVNVREFKTLDDFYNWLGKHHDKEREVWVKIHKVGSGLESITPKEAIDAALCWGWIDGLRKAFDGKSFLQRYTPRGKKSVWSQINVENVARLTRQGRMTTHGLQHVNAAKSDGRWDRAYKGGKEMTIPDDLLAAINAEPKSRKMFQQLNAQNRYALAFRVHNMKTDAGRRKKIETFVEMLKRGETIYPQPRK